MNYSQWLDDQKDPLYEVLGKDNIMPKCPTGYKWNQMTMRCEPKTEKDNVNGQGDKKMPGGQLTNEWPAIHRRVFYIPIRELRFHCIAGKEPSMNSWRTWDA